MLLLLLQIPCTTRIMIWGQVAQVLAAKEQAKEGELSIWEAEHFLDAELFLDEYPRWDVRGLHCPFILQGMFVHAAECGLKEAERLIYHGHWQGLPKPGSGVDVTAIQLVGYQNIQGRNWGPLPASIHAQEIAWTPTVWAIKSTRDNRRHCVFLEWLPKVEKGEAVRRRRWRTGVCQHSSLLPLQLRKVGHFGGARTHQGQGGPLAGPGSCCHTGAIHRKT